ncbi:hypothetical protein [Pseudomonas sp. JUb52]|uniref:hypothetical protein n=1 Tax=Pseudomonas sp. JUb52 TaxID=2485127 RepID=UPI00104C5EC2|nr:hypothetical protein [Pseudomonas sp. JUb52]TCQ92614.1 hypothetical protein EC839_102404 [Pseudomonas sp. JUb52]
MDVYVFETARRLLTDIYGALYEMHNGNGFRCVRPQRGQIFLYRPSAGLAEGNAGEIAFEVESHARRAGKGITETRRFFEGLRVANGHAIARDGRYDWIRVGFSEKQEVAFIALQLEVFLKLRD